MSHWTEKQQNRFQEILEAQDRGECKVAYWNSDAFGFPANHNCKDLHWRVEPGKIQEVEGPLELCTPRALHATLNPHKWKGSRVWIVALWGEIQEHADKLGALKREIVGEILPHEAFNESVGVRLGRKDLSGAYLSRAELIGADLSRADLSGAYLRFSNLADSNLSSANLSGADLFAVYLAGSNLFKTNLHGANLPLVNLYRANLTGANLSGANLSGANLPLVNLTRANLTGANLSGVNLSGAYVGLDVKINGWLNINGYLQK